MREKQEKETFLNWVLLPCASHPIKKVIFLCPPKDTSLSVCFSANIEPKRFAANNLKHMIGYKYDIHSLATLKMAMLVHLSN